MSAVVALALSDEDRTRVERVESLARAGASGATSLVELLDDPSWAVRRAIVAALAGIGEPAIPLLCNVIEKQRDDEGRLAATVDALVASQADVESRMMDLAKSSAVPAVVCDAVQVLGRRRAHASVDLLAGLSTHADDNVAVGAIEALGRIGGPQTVDALIAAVESKHFFRTFPGIDALGRTGDTRAIAPLSSLLGDPLYALEAARALGRTGQAAAVVPLAALLERAPDALVRATAVALAELRERYEGRFGDNAAIAASLPKAVSPSLASDRVIGSVAGLSSTELVAVARVLGWLGAPSGIAHLVEMVMSDAPVGPAAADALRRLGPAATPMLLAAIRSGDSNRRLRVLPIVGYAAGSLDDLVSCLDDPDSDVRARACEALARLGNPAAVTSLFRLIGERDGRVSQAAAAAIQSLGSLETKRLALEQARSTDTRTRRAALRIISYFGYREGLDILVEAMTDEDEKIREAAIYGLPLVEDSRGTTALLAVANHPVAKTRATVMRALGQTEARSEVVTVLRSALLDEDPWVRYYACQALGRLRIEDATDPIIGLMKDPTGQVRVAAVEALAHLRDERAGEALAAAARSDDNDMRRAALVGLGIARRPSAIAILREAAAAADAATRLVAIGALSELDGAEVVPTLAHAASDPDEAVRSAAIGYLSTHPGADATSALLDQLANASGRERVLDALTVAADQRVDSVLAALETADADRAPLLVAALARMRRPSSQAAIAAALGGDNVHARRAAAAALAAIGTPEAREALARAGSADPDADVRRICHSVVRNEPR